MYVGGYKYMYICTVESGINSLMRWLNDAPTKRPKTKRPSPKTSQIQNVTIHKVQP
jgi:hypothetical protein